MAERKVTLKLDIAAGDFTAARAKLRSFADDVKREMEARVKFTPPAPPKPLPLALPRPGTLGLVPEHQELVKGGILPGVGRLPGPEPEGQGAGALRLRDVQADSARKLQLQDREILRAQDLLGNEQKLAALVRGELEVDEVRAKLAAALAAEQARLPGLVTAAATAEEQRLAGMRGVNEALNAQEAATARINAQARPDVLQRQLALNVEMAESQRRLTAEQAKLPALALAATTAEERRVGGLRAVNESLAAQKERLAGINAQLDPGALRERVGLEKQILDAEMKRDALLGRERERQGLPLGKPAAEKPGAAPDVLGPLQGLLPRGGILGAAIGAVQGVLKVLKIDPAQLLGSVLGGAAGGGLKGAAGAGLGNIAGAAAGKALNLGPPPPPPTVLGTRVSEKAAAGLPNVLPAGEGAGALGGLEALAGPLALAAAAGAGLVTVLGSVKDKMLDLAQQAVHLAGVAQPGVVRLYTRAWEDFEGVLGQRTVPVVRLMTEGVRFLGDALNTVLPSQQAVNQALAPMRSAWLDLKNTLTPIVLDLAPLVRTELVGSLAALGYAIKGVVIVLDPFLTQLGTLSGLVASVFGADTKLLPGFGAAGRTPEFTEARGLSHSLIKAGFEFGRPGAKHETVGSQLATLITKATAIVTAVVEVGATATSIANKVGAAVAVPKAAVGVGEGIAAGIAGGIGAAARGAMKGLPFPHK